MKNSTFYHSTLKRLICLVTLATLLIFFFNTSYGQWDDQFYEGFETPFSATTKIASDLPENLTDVPNWNGSTSFLYDDGGCIVQWNKTPNYVNNVTFEEPRTGDFCLVVADVDDGSDIILEHNISYDFSSMTDVQLHFYYQIQDMDLGEYAKFEVWNGSDWIQVWISPEDTDYDTYQEVSVNCNTHINANFKVRLLCKMSAASDIFCLDDFKIQTKPVCSFPANQATNFGTSSIASTTMTVSWTRGTPSGGDNVLVVAKAGSAPEDPYSGTSYTANAAYGSGTAVGGGYAVYKGTGTLVNLTSLTGNTTYYFAIYEYDNTGPCYNRTELSGNETTLKNAPTTQANTISFTEVSCLSMTVDWINGNGDKRVVKINTSNSFTAPSDGTDPAANSVYGGSGEQVVYNGSYNGVNVSGLSATTTYWFRIYEYNNTGTDTKYITSTASNNPKSQSTLTGSCTATWQGDTETFGRWEWGTAGNWDIDIVPTSVYDVVIPASPSGGHQPLMYYEGGVCKNLTNNGTIYGDNATQLDIYGNYSGTGSFAGESVTVYFKGGADVTISGSPTFTGYFYVEKANSSVKVTLASNISANIAGIYEGILDMGAGYDASFPSITIYDGGKLYIHNSGSAFTTIDGHFNVNQGGTLDIDDGQINIYALFLVDGALDMSGGTITQNGWTVNESVWMANSTITITAGTIDFQTCNRFDVWPASTNISGGTIKVAKNMNYTNNFTPTGGVVELYSTNIGEIANNDDENSWLYRLVINKTGAGVATYKGANPGYDPIVVKENLYINTGGFNTLDGYSELIVYGDWYNNSGSDLFGEDGTVYFKGGANSTIYGPPGGETFAGLQIEKNSSAQTVILTDDIDVTDFSDPLVLVSGTITTGSYIVNVLEDDEESIDDGSEYVTHDYSDSWVYGNLSRVIDATSASGIHDFPVGTNSNSNLLQLTANSLDGISQIDCYFKATPTTPNLNFPNDLTDLGTKITGVAEEGVWVLNPTGNSNPVDAGNYDLKLYFNGFSGLEDGKFNIISRPSDLNNGTNWELCSGTHSSTTVSDGYAYRTGCNSFSEKGIGKTDAVLPIELLFFTAVCKDDEVQLNWASASETNNDFFTIEKSHDAKHFEVVTTIFGAGNSNTVLNYSVIDKCPYKETTYYRLKQTDYNGAYEYFDMVAVNCKIIADNDLEFIYAAQNQNRDGITVLFNSNEETEFGLYLFDILGHKIVFENSKSDYGINLININTGNLPCGIYLVVLQNENKAVTKKIMVN